MIGVAQKIKHTFILINALLNFLLTMLFSMTIFCQGDGMNKEVVTEKTIARNSKFLDHPNAPLVKCRLDNLEYLLDAYGSKVKLAGKIGISNAQIGQYFAVGKNYFRPIGDAVARRIEVELGLPPYVMDHHGGVAGAVHDNTQAASCSNPVAPLAPTLKALHQASLDAFREALVEGRISDSECIEMLSKWVNSKAMETSSCSLIQSEPPKSTTIKAKPE